MPLSVFICMYITTTIRKALRNRNLHHNKKIERIFAATAVAQQEKHMCFIIYACVYSFIYVKATQNVYTFFSGAFEWNVCVCVWCILTDADCSFNGCLYICDIRGKKNRQQERATDGICNFIHCNSYICVCILV